MIGVKHRARRARRLAPEARKFHGATRGTAAEFNNAVRGPRDRLEFNTNLKEISSVSGAQTRRITDLSGGPFARGELSTEGARAGARFPRGEGRRSGLIN